MSDALARLDDYVRGATHADDDAYEDDLFMRALAGTAPELKLLDSLVATLRVLGERGTLMIACGRAEAERLRALHGARADYRELSAAPEQAVVLSPDAEIVITHVPLPLDGVERVDIENHVEGHGLLKTFPDVVFERGAAGLYLCCDGSLARQTVGHTVIAKFIGHRNGEKTVLLETKSTTSIATV